MKHVLGVLAAGAGLTPARSTCICFSNDELHKIIDAYVTNSTAAEATHGAVATWDVTCVADMSATFVKTAFNGDVRAWDVSQVTTMRSMFFGATAFNGDLGDWDVSKVVDMGYMFAGSSFNGDLVAWDVSSATDMGSMFYYSSLDRALGWILGEGVDLADAFAGTACAATSCGVVTVEMVGDFSFAEPHASSRRLATCDNIDAVHAAAASYSLVCKYCFTNDGLETAVAAWFADEASAKTTYAGIAGWDVSCATDMEWLFEGHRGTGAFNADLGDWDVSEVTNMEYTFKYATSFNGDLGDWDVSKVTTMEGMFSYAEKFNADLSAWDVSKVTTMEMIFYYCSEFNGDLSAWDVSEVTNMLGMFLRATAFNRNLGDWDVSKVTTMVGMFSMGLRFSKGAGAFNGDLSAWDVSKVTNMANMFEDATAFNGDLSAWDVSQVTDDAEDMYGMFFGATAFNGDLGDWDVSKVTTMEYMFEDAVAFNRDLGDWDVSKVTTMANMFRNAAAFNADLGTWDVSQVTNMKSMFDRAYIFNADLSDWDLSKVTDMFAMFWGASAFNSPLDWCVAPTVKITDAWTGTKCEATTCGVVARADCSTCAANERVQDKKCVACPAGTTNAPGDDASKSNTDCDATMCLANQHVKSNACVACPVPETNAAGDDASGKDTDCDACKDSNGSARDFSGKGCDWYDANPRECGKDDPLDGSFASMLMCCACQALLLTVVPESCKDSNGDAKDSYGDDCAWYASNPSTCGDSDDGDFKANDMCCICSTLWGSSSGSSSKTGSVVIAVPVVCGAVLLAAAVYGIARKRGTKEKQSHREGSMPSVALETTTN